MLSRKSLAQAVARTLVVTALAVTALAVTAPCARADIAIAADFEGNAPLSLDGVSVAPAFGIRLGLQLHLPLIAITPELGYHHANYARGPAINRGLVGARVSIGEILRFGVSAHLGFGAVDVEIADEAVSETAFSFDAGIFLDLTVLPLLDIGLHAGYGSVGGDESVGVEPVQWMAFGAHVALII